MDSKGVTFTVPAITTAAVAAGGDVLSPEELERQRQREITRLRMLSQRGGYLSPHERSFLRHPLGKGSGGTLVGGQECGRNAPCPCGSGRKYKNCCRLKSGKIYAKEVKVKHTVTNA